MRRNGVRKSASQASHSVFHRRVFCGACGWAYKKKVSNGIVYWVCSGKSVAGHRCSGINVRESELQEAFVMMYNKLRFFEKEVLDTALKQMQQVKEKLSGQSHEVSQIDMEIARLCDTNHMYARLHGQGIIDDVSFLERTAELKYKITEQRKKRMKLLHENEDEQLFDRLHALKETLTDYPKTMINFDAQLFCDITEKVIVGNSLCLTFQLLGGLQLQQESKEVI